MQLPGAQPLNLSEVDDVYRLGSVASSFALQGRIEALLERYRGKPTSPSKQEINDLYTDGCAAVLALETDRLRLKQRMRAALMDGAIDPEAAREGAALAIRGEDLRDELGQLKELVRQLRTAVDWAQDNDPRPGPPRRHFRRTA